MTKTPAPETIDNAIAAFRLAGIPRSVNPHGNGHINDTYLVICDDAGNVKKYILQRMNHSIFRNPQALMENVAGVTSYLQEKIRERNGDPNR